MKCKYCGCENFIGHQVTRMDVLVDGEGEFVSNLPGGFSNIYASEKPYGDFTCCNCGAEYEKLEDESSPVSKPDPNSIGPNRSVMFYDGSIRFKKELDKYLDDPDCRFQRWESTHYKVCVEVHESGYVYVFIHRQDNLPAYFPNLFVETSNDNQCTPASVSVSTSSFGTITLDEMRAILQAAETAYEQAQAIEDLFIRPLRDGKFDVCKYEKKD